jgi:glutathione synthase/RimK-type ligase-like ATP-grasp enzyme
LDDDDAPLIAALAERGVGAAIAVWDDPQVDWEAFDLVAIRSTWDYALRREEFVRWAASVPRLQNPAGAIRWNTDKHYLADLARVGIPVIPTDWLEPSSDLSSRRLHTRFPALGDFVIKPAVSGGSLDSGRYSAGSPRSRGLAIRHAQRLLAAGRTVMVQRYVTSVDEVGETALVFVDGQFAWGARRSAMLEGPDTGAVGTYRKGAVRPVEATAAEVAIGERALGAARELMGEGGGQPWLAARVDVVAADAGPQVLEVELTHPSLYLSLIPGGPDRVARAIAARAGLTSRAACQTTRLTQAPAAAKGCTS